MDCRHVQGQTLADLAPKDLQARVMPNMSWEANVQRLAVQLLEVRLVTLHHLRSWQLRLCTTSRLAAKHTCVFADCGHAACKDQMCTSQHHKQLYRAVGAAKACLG